METPPGAVRKVEFQAFGPPEIGPEEIIYLEKIGGGCFGSVHKGMCRGQDVAIKKLFRQDLSEKAVNEFRKEVEICSRLHHPNVLMFMGACTVPGQMAIVMELMPKGNLETLLHDPKVRLSLFKRMMMSKEIAKGMNWLHLSNPQIIHRDLKPSNLLVDNHGHIRVCDFGLAAVKPANEKLKDKDSIPGTPLWMAPEVMMGRPLDEKSDVYSFGLVLWEITTLNSPFPDMSNFAVFRRAVCFQDQRPPVPDDLLPSLAELIKLCWHKSAETRPSFSEIITMLNSILVECAISDPDGRAFWMANCPGHEQMDWDTFVNAFYQATKSDFPANPADDPRYLCLKTILSENNPDKNRIDAPKVVNIEKFGAVLDWFGPMITIPDDTDVISRIMRTCKQPWFHGDIDGKEAEQLLRVCNEGAFLIRLSTTVRGSFTISKVSSNEDKRKQIAHQRIDYKPGVGFTIRITENGQTKLLRSPPNSSLRSFIKPFEEMLSLIEPCPSQKFRSIFQKKKVELPSSSLYLPDASE